MKWILPLLLLPSLVFAEESQVEILTIRLVSNPNQMVNHRHRFEIKSMEMVNLASCESMIESIGRGTIKQVSMTCVRKETLQPDLHVKCRNRMCEIFNMKTNTFQPWYDSDRSLLDMLTGTPAYMGY